MRKMIIGICCLAIAVPAYAQSTSVRPHVRKDGTFVQGHRRTNPNSSVYDNWSTKPNVNPYTGRTGTVDPYTSTLNRSYPRTTAPTYRSATPSWQPPKTSTKPATNPWKF